MLCRHDSIVHCSRPLDESLCNHYPGCLSRCACESSRLGAGVLRLDSICITEQKDRQTYLLPPLYGFGQFTTCSSSAPTQNVMILWAGIMSVET